MREVSLMTAGDWKRWQGYVKNQASRAIRSGLLVRPNICSLCNNTGKIEAHHDDYGKPLVVRWLCKKCHAKTTWQTVNHKDGVFPIGASLDEIIEWHKKLCQDVILKLPAA